MPVGYRRVSSMSEPRQDPTQDHPKGLVHGTGIAICSDKDSFYLPFCTRMQLYILTNSVGLMQKIQDQALILKLGKSTSQEINPNCRPGSRAPLETGNHDNCRPIMQWAKEKKSPLFRVVRVERKYYIAGKVKKWLLNKRNDISTKRSNILQWVAVHFDQFLANLVRAWFG